MDSVDGRTSTSNLFPLLIFVSFLGCISYLDMATAVSDSRASSMDPRMEDSFHTLNGFSPVTLLRE